MEDVWIGGTLKEQERLDRPCDPELEEASIENGWMDRNQQGILQRLIKNDPIKFSLQPIQRLSGIREKDMVKRPVQGVPRLSPNDRWDTLQPATRPTD